MRMRSSAAVTGFRAYTGSDRESCLALFDANCPEYFAPHERADYAEFLDPVPVGYEVCESDGSVVGAFGLVIIEGRGARLCWIMLAPDYKGGGLGAAMMDRIIAKGRELETPTIGIAASQKSAPFFAKFGAETIKETRDGWGPGLDRIDMELRMDHSGQRPSGSPG